MTAVSVAPDLYRHEEAPMKKQLPEGVTERHQRSCARRRGKRCSCRPTFQAQAWSPQDHRRVTRTFPTPEQAASWRVDAERELRRGTLRAGATPTLREAADEWLAGARAGTIRNRSGDTFKPSSIRGYEQALRIRVLPALGGSRLADVRRSDIQRLVDRLLRTGLDASTIRNTLMPLRSIYRRALALDVVAVNPTTGVGLPAVRGRRDRFASPQEAESLLGALPAAERSLWATALFSGLRLGELLALRWEDVDFKAGLIRVRYGWDPKEGEITPKSGAGRRNVPLASVLRRHLLEQKLRTTWTSGFVFGRGPKRPFSRATAAARAGRAWKDAKLEPIGFHECRHTFASLMIAAGVNAKALTVFMGHSSITTTYDRYGHLMDGSEKQAAQLLDTYLDEAIQ